MISKSALARYESGASLPPLKYHAHLDALYGGSGWVSLALRALRRGGWDPWADQSEVKAHKHAGKWPAEYDGDVWMKVVPTPRTVQHTHRVSLAWGPWKCEIECAPGAGGVLLVTSKAADDSGAAVTLRLSCDREVFVLFGAGDRVGDEPHVIDINGLWS